MSGKTSSSLQSHNGLFWAFWHKKYCKTSGAKLRSAIELSSLKWSDDSESPWWIYICRLPIDSTVYSFPTLDFVRGIFWIFLPASSPRKPLLNMNFMFLWKKGEKETLKKKKKARGLNWISLWLSLIFTAKFVWCQIFLLVFDVWKKLLHIVSILYPKQK